MEITITPLPADKIKDKIKDQAQLGFGKYFTDRMLLVEWKAGQGWVDARVKPHEPFQLDPACAVLHYAQEIFEGLKAYKWDDGRVALFRPEMNARRFNQSAERICMPAVPEELFLKGIEQLVALEKDWIPTAPETSLYIRPAMIAVDPVLGVKPSDHYYFFVILSPVGAYYAAGFNPVNILVEDRYVRAVPGGTGEAKTGGNYASSLMAAQEAKKKGFDQVLWLDGRERRYIEEVGAMNMFFAYGNKIVTAPLTGTILSGVTRDSVLTLAPTLGYEVEERLIDIAELMADIRAGKVTEAFGSGTAAVITPVGKLCYKDECLQLTGGRVGDITQKLYDTLTGIQTGKIKDEFGWVRFVA
ncbi:branched-chain amino acid aminotransferase [Geobacter sp. SVR]|uniref:branched-chain amino acid aminotransferase n=1 Tax=Geobacter sp. SVR TaxID=2495594 RepID=UPI00143F0468|nr:branched-chain amino acid aminotransferase [Geobacter sp. SVR]BCS54682.1 branched chain amino acid aminotransferase [Geobacter sp. SVR]GCF87622.1 branched chain amino acid aminotransferase [Geobacter sp. SVR]